ncbi:MAG: class I SAM-dependent methyltransferase [Anaerolineae bacterium]|nr:class I SAM-dependent methyltransferase [Anaerolineae bacterium]
MKYALALIEPGQRVLELGCAQGRFARLLPAGCQYLGVDFSASLIALARSQAYPILAHFVVADLMEQDWVAQVNPPYDVILARAVLHHIPGYANRLRILQQAAALLPPTGRMILANWQVLAAERFRKRLQPWESIGLSESDVEPGDCLLDWRREGFGLRFVHHVSADEAQRIACDAELEVVEMYASDGREGNLTLYTVMARQN